MRRLGLALLACLLLSGQAMLPGFPPGLFSNRAALTGGGGASLSCSYTPVTSATYNVPYTGATPSPSGGSGSYTSYANTGSSLPPGITLNTSTGVLSGTDSTDSGGATYPGIQLQVTDSLSNTANCGTSFTITVAGASYSGPGDVFSTGIFGWYSCARAYNAAWASGTHKLCLLYGATTTTTCTLVSKTNGFADLTSLSCAGGTTSVTTFCTVTNSSCYVETAYDQSGNGYDMTQATPASMPRLLLSSTPTGTLPSLSCPSFVGTLQVTIPGASGPTYTFSAVMERTAGTAGATLIGSSGGVTMGFSGSGLANVSAGTALTLAATENTWHAVNGLSSGSVSTSAINVDGTDQTGNAGTLTMSTTMRICRVTGTTDTVGLAEIGVWQASSTSTNRNALSTNQHGTNGYNF